jgi:hypothetical protein
MELYRPVAVSVVIPSCDAIGGRGLGIRPCQKRYWPWLEELRVSVNTLPGVAFPKVPFLRSIPHSLHRRARTWAASSGLGDGCPWLEALSSDGNPIPCFPGSPTSPSFDRRDNRADLRCDPRMRTLAGAARAAVLALA